MSTPVTVSINGADVTIGGTNDVPTIVAELTTATGAVTEDAAAILQANGTITYQDVDLTDTHAASFVLKSSDASANLPGFAEGNGEGAANIGHIRVDGGEREQRRHDQYRLGRLDLHA